MKNNLEYYQHNVNSHNHWKFKTLRRKYGWAGEGKFWALNNMIGESEGCQLSVSDPDKKASIAADLDFDIQEFDEFIDCLINVCKLVKDMDGYLATKITQENLSAVNDKRKRQRDWKKQKSTSTLPESTETSPELVVDLQQSKVKESKVKETKVNNINTNTAPAGADDVSKKKVTPKPDDMPKKNNPADEIPLPFPEKEFADKWEEWLKYRKERRIAAYVPTGLKATFTKLMRISQGDYLTAIQIIDQSRENGWAGLFEIKTNMNGKTHQRLAEKPQPTGNVAPGGFGQF